MKVFHTSDLHLTTDNNERWDTLEILLKKATTLSTDIFVISGDLFENNKYAFEIYDNLRKLFGKYHNYLLIIILPGNHDSKSYEKGIWLGDNVKIITTPLEPVITEKLIFWGLPFTNLGDDLYIPQQINKINNEIDKKYNDKINILLYHGELLDLFSMKRDFGEEDSNQYMPAKLSYFENSYFKYILAGHFHTKPHIFNTKNKNNEEMFFIYPGTPVSITAKELGKRSINIIEPPYSPKIYSDFNSFFYEKLLIVLEPNKNPTETIDNKISLTNKQATLLVEINGYFNGDNFSTTETNIKKYIEKKLIDYNIKGDIIYNFKNIGNLLDSNLYERINKKINLLTNDKTEKEIIKNIIIKGLIEAQF